MIYSNEYIDMLMFTENKGYQRLTDCKRLSVAFVFVNYSKEVYDIIRFKCLNMAAVKVLIKKWNLFGNALKPYIREKSDGDFDIDLPYANIDWFIMPLFTRDIPDFILNSFETKEVKEKEHKVKKKKNKKEGRLTEEEKAERRKERKADRRINSIMVQSNLDFVLDEDLRKIIRRGIECVPTNDNSTSVQKDIRFISLDVGVKNFCTVCSNVFSPYLISGHTMTKALGYYDSMYNHDDFGRYAMTKRFSKSNKNKRLEKRNDILHEFIVLICDRLMQNVKDYNIDTIIFGYPDLWSKKTNLMSKDMTVMYQRTLANFKEMLKKRCNRHNIVFAEIDEAYTSVCSFVDNEDIHAKEEYCGKRVTRDKYYSKQGYSIHADVNASYNIAKKYLVNNSIWSDIYFTQMVAMLNNSRFISVLKQGYEAAVAEELARKEELRHEGKRNMVRY